MSESAFECILSENFRIFSENFRTCESVTDSELVFVLLHGLPSGCKGVREALEKQDALTEGVSATGVRQTTVRQACG